MIPMNHQTTTGSTAASMPNRRRFLQTCSAAALLSQVPSAFAGLRSGQPPADGRCLVLIRMGGGNDGLNTVIPAEDDLYQRARPTLGISAPNALPLGGPHYLHPALTGLKELFDDGRLAVLQGIGYRSPDRSHFRSMDIWDSAVDDRIERRTGWIGRALSNEPTPTPGSTPAIAITGGEMPLALAGLSMVPPALPSVNALLPVRDDLPLGVTRSSRTTDSPTDFVRAATHGALDIAGRLRGRTSSNDLPRTGLGRALGTVLDLIQAEVSARVFYVPFDGFDTHTRQADQHAALLRELGDAVLGFQNAARKQGLGDRIVVATYSEFGRRVRENGSRGTDHGAAAPLFVAGDPVRGGVVGDAPDLTDLDDGDVRFRHDFREVYATLLDRWLGVDSSAALGRDYPMLPFLS